MKSILPLVNNNITIEFNISYDNRKIYDFFLHLVEYCFKLTYLTEVKRLIEKNISFIVSYSNVNKGIPLKS